MLSKPAAICPHASQGRSGFSLVELTFVILLIGILAAVGVPRMSHLVAGYRVDSAADRIAADLRFAARQARLTGRSETVTFDIATNRYSFSSAPSASAPASIYSVDVSAYPYASTIEDAAFDGQPLVKFDGYGFPAAGGKIVVQSSATRRLIKLSDVTGHVTWEDVSTNE